MERLHLVLLAFVASMSSSAAAAAANSLDANDVGSIVVRPSGNATAADVVVEGQELGSLVEVEEIIVEPIELIGTAAASIDTTNPSSDGIVGGGGGGGDDGGGDGGPHIRKKRATHRRGRRYSSDSSNLSHDLTHHPRSSSRHSSSSSKTWETSSGGGSGGTYTDTDTEATDSRRETFDEGTDSGHSTRSRRPNRSHTVRRNSHGKVVRSIRHGKSAAETNVHVLVDGGGHRSSSGHRDGERGHRSRRRRHRHSHHRPHHHHHHRRRHYGGSFTVERLAEYRGDSGAGRERMPRRREAFDRRRRGHAGRRAHSVQEGHRDRHYDYGYDDGDDYSYRRGNGNGRYHRRRAHDYDYYDYYDDDYDEEFLERRGRSGHRRHGHTSAPIGPFYPTFMHNPAPDPRYNNGYKTIAKVGVSPKVTLLGVTLQSAHLLSLKKRISKKSSHHPDYRRPTTVTTVPTSAMPYLFPNAVRTF